jgi:Tol biopolymer transport system component
VLTDPIPFDKLAPGMLLFQRIGPPGDRYMGAYVVATGQQRSRGISYVPVNDPSVSPDGSRIAFTSYSTIFTAEDVYLVRFDGTNLERVSDLAAKEQSPSWASDGRHMFFIAVPLNASDDSVQLYRQSPVRYAADRVLVFDSGKRKPPMHIRGPVSASSAGLLLAGGDGVYTISEDGSRVNVLIQDPGDGKALYSPAWSPDGQNIAVLLVARDTAGIRSVAVIVYTADGAGADTLVTLPASGRSEWPGNNSYSLSWSPDGSQIAFTRPDGVDVGSHIYVIGQDHTGPTQVTFATGVIDRSLSWGKEVSVADSVWLRKIGSG